MWLMLQQDEPQDYVVATGVAHSVREFCERAFNAADLDMDQHVTIDQQLFRPAEVDVLVGDSTKAIKELGWKAEVRFADLVTEMVEADIAAIS